MLKFIIILLATVAFAYYAYYAFTGTYFDIPYLPFI